MSTITIWGGYDSPLNGWHTAPITSQSGRTAADCWRKVDAYLRATKTAGHPRRLFWSTDDVTSPLVEFSWIGARP